jgi:predicted site-specific integrase-resolvase
MITRQPTELESHRRWMKPRQWRELTGMPHGTTHLMIRQGKLQAVRVGNRLYIPATKIVDFFERHGKPAA